MIRYVQIESPSEKDLDLIIKLEREIFKDFEFPLEVKQRALGQKNLLADIAYDDEKMIAFKLGYEHSPEAFYSWLGGVLPEYRHQGLGAELLQRQHQKVKDWGYKSIRTYSRNRFVHMMILNIKNGFRIVGTQYRESEKDIAIIFEKIF